MSTEDATHIIEIVQNYKADESTKKEDDDNKHDETANNTTAATPVAEEGIFAKATHFVENHLPGGIKEKAEEMIGGLGSKVAGFFK